MEALGLEVNILEDLESHTKNLLEICNLSLYQYHQLTNVHSRITEILATTVDLLLTNNKEFFTHSGVCHIGISDTVLLSMELENFVFPKGN